MNIDKGNIDEWLFRYFEKDLSSSETDQLMSFIHKNPHYEKDFIDWKKSYHHMDRELEDYEIAAVIKSKFKPVFYYKRISIVLGLLAISSFVFYNTCQNNHTTNTPIISNKKEASPANKTNSITTLPQIDTSSEATIPIKQTTRPIIKKESSQKLLSSPIHTTNVQIEKKHNYAILEPLTVQESKIKKDTITSLPVLKSIKDTVATTSTTETKKVKTIEKKEVEKKKGIYKTTDKIIPINTNF